MTFFKEFIARIFRNINDNQIPSPLTSTRHIIRMTEIHKMCPKVVIINNVERQYFLRSWVGDERYFTIEKNDVEEFIKQDGIQQFRKTKRVQEVDKAFGWKPDCDDYAYIIMGKLKDWAPGAAAGVVSCLLYTSPSPRDLSTSRMPSSA